jgi:hypothetical protein
MSKEVKEYLQHQSDHTLHTKAAAAHAAALKGAVAAGFPDRIAFHRALQEAHDEKAGFSAAMMADCEKSIITSNLEKLSHAAGAGRPISKPNVPPEFEKLVILEETNEPSLLGR